MAAWYRSGTVSVTNLSANLVFVGTTLLTQASVGDMIYLPDGNPYELTAIADDTHATIKRRDGTASYAGSTLAGQNYSILRNFTSTTNAQVAADLSSALLKFHTSFDDLAAWLSGTGSVPVHDSAGNVYTLKTPAALAAYNEGMLSKSVAGGSNVTLTSTEYANGFIIATGVLTANINVIVPLGWRGVFRNSTTGAFTLTVKAATGTGVVVTQGRQVSLIGDGTNISEVIEWASPGAIGSVTPNTASFTTVTLSGTGQRLLFTGAGTSNAYASWANTGASAIAGIESSAGGSLLTGSAAYSAFFATTGATPAHIGTNGVVRVTVQDTKLVFPIASYYQRMQGGIVGSFSAGITFSDSAYYNGAAWVNEVNNTTPIGVFQVSNGNFIWNRAPTTAVPGTPAWVEAARITTSGFFKATSSGSYNSGNNTSFHEFSTSTASTNSLVLTHFGATPIGLHLNYAGAAPNGTANEFLFFLDTGTTRFKVASNGGKYGFTANDVNLSDEQVKTDWTDADVSRYWDGHLKLKYGTFLYIDQADDIPNLGLGARHTGEIFPELRTTFSPEVAEHDEFDNNGNFVRHVAFTPERKGLFETDLFYMHGVIIQRLQQEVAELKALRLPQL